MDRASAIQKATLKDRAAFIVGRRAIRMRLASADEKVQAGIPVSTDAIAVLIRLCHETIKVVVVERPLAGDVSEAAAIISRLEGRPRAETIAAATYFPLISADDLALLGHQMMAARSGCAQCRCSSGYAPLVAALALAAAEANLKPWAVSGLNEHFSQIKAALPAPLTTSAPDVKAIADAIRTIIRAAGYTEPLAGAEGARK